MRLFPTLLTIFLLAAVATPQVMISQPAYAPNAQPVPAFRLDAPLINTPIIDLSTVSPNAVGARSATAGLQAGATNSTLSEFPATEFDVRRELPWEERDALPSRTGGDTRVSRKSSFDVGVGSLIDGPGNKSLAQAALDARAKSHGQNVRTITNSNIQSLQNTGMQHVRGQWTSGDTPKPSTGTAGQAGEPPASNQSEQDPPSPR